MKGNHIEASCQFGSRRSKHKSLDFIDKDSVSLERCRPQNVAMDTMSCALRKAAWSLFSDENERAHIPTRFSRSSFISYDGKTNTVEHVSHYIQMMSLHSQNDALICKVFPSNLRPIALLWFNGLRKGSIHNIRELIQEFGVWFMMCSQVP